MDRTARIVPGVVSVRASLFLSRTKLGVHLALTMGLCGSSLASSVPASQEHKQVHDPLTGYSCLTAFECPCDLITNCRREPLDLTIRHDRDALGRRAYVTNQSNWNSYVLDGLQDRVCLVRRDRDQQCARRKQFKRIERERIANRVGFGQHGDALPNDLEPETAWRHQLDEPRREPTFGRIVHCVHGIADIGSRECRTHDTDAGVNEETSAPLENICIHPSSQLLGLLSRQDRSALDGHALCQQDLIAYGNMGLPHKASRGDFAKHLPHQNRAVQALGDFRVSTSESDIQFFTRVPHIRHDCLGQLGCRAILWKKHDNEKPERPCAQDGNVVRVDVNCVTADLIGGKGDGIGPNDEIVISGVDDGRVLTNLRSNEQARIMLRRMPQQRSHMLKRKFADGQNLLRLTSSHVLMIIDEAAGRVKDRIRGPRFTLVQLRKTKPMPDVPAERRFAMDLSCFGNIYAALSLSNLPT